MDEFQEILIQATRNVPEEYFQLPIDGAEEPLYRERVYCYELYHQMRSLWPPQSHFTLSGEVDKAGHPLIRDNGLDNTKPDFLVHIPGDMGGNFAVIEVKPIIATRAGIKKDLETLSAFTNYAGYAVAILLIYGDGDIGRIMQNVMTLRDECVNNEIDLQNVNILWHRAVTEPAHLIR
ncbi:hypothetical protein P9J64_02940 [Deltaproteobacteria bacterium IMCC39524]|nr:hypothetical protein [Deltaproteobacteria bacterium IMCC39524]